MSNKNYVRGRAFEYSVMAFFRKRGYYCLRAYGSKGLYDVIAIPPKHKTGIFNYPLLIQAKLNGYVRISSNSYDVNNESYSLAEMNFVTDSANGYTGGIAFRTNSGERIILKVFDLLDRDDNGKHYSR